MDQTGSAGRRGEDVRSDCWVELEPRDKGGLKLMLKSKVDYLYAESNRQLVTETMLRLGLEHARVTMEDKGALPFTIMARVEAAARQALPEDPLPEVLPEPHPESSAPTSRDRWRRSRLYIPGNTPRFFANVHIHGADAVILDLEDAVPPEEHDSALVLVRNALLKLPFGESERMVRTSQFPEALKDIPPLVRARVQTILLPKVEQAEQVAKAAELVQGTRASAGIESPVFLMPIIESPLGMFNALDIAQASDLVVALTWGQEDYLKELGGRKTAEGHETLWPMSQVANAARAAGVQPIDTVFSDIADMDGLRESCRRAQDLGFEGKGCIHPNQVPVVNQAFTPDREEVGEAVRITEAWEKAQKSGRVTLVLDGKMVDLPIVERARRIVKLARAAGLLSEENRE